MLRAYSMGAGTYTGIEAVSNGLPILREPKVQTGKRTMQYMAISLAFTATGLMFAYLFLHVSYHEGKTLNAVLFENADRQLGRRRPVVRVDHVDLRSAAAVRRRPGGFPRRPPRPLQHGARSLDADKIRHAQRPPRHAKRHPAHGRRGAWV